MKTIFGYRRRWVYRLQPHRAVGEGPEESGFFARQLLGRQEMENHIKGATYIEGDTNDIERLWATAATAHPLGVSPSEEGERKKTIKPDLVYHLGEYARVEKSFEDMSLV